MAAAIFGLVGVLVGAFAAGGFDLFFERRREQADLRQARRLVADEVHTQWLHHDLLLEAGRYPKHNVEQMMPTAAWEANKATLARHLSDELWGFLAIVEHSMNRAAESLQRKTPEAPISPDDAKSFENGKALVARAHQELTGKPPD